MLSLTRQFLEAEQKRTIWLCIIICTFRSLPLPFPTPEGNKVRLVRTKSKMSHRLTLWIKEKIRTANSVSIVNHLGLAWIPSLRDKALSPTLSPKAQLIRLEGGNKKTHSLASKTEFHLFTFLEKNQVGNLPPFLLMCCLLQTSHNGS